MARPAIARAGPVEFALHSRRLTSKVQQTYVGHFAAALGLGLWRTLPTGWWVVELAVIAVLWMYSWRRSKTDERFGRRPLAIAAVLLVLHAFNSPWLAQF